MKSKKVRKWLQLRKRRLSATAEDDEFQYAKQMVAVSRTFTEAERQEAVASIEEDSQ